MTYKLIMRGPLNWGPLKIPVSICCSIDCNRLALTTLATQDLNATELLRVNLNFGVLFERM